MKLTTKLTDKNIVLPPGRNDEILWDPSLIGFGCRVRQGSGRVIKTWLVLYRHHGRSRRMNIADADKVDATQARAKAKELLAQAELGHDPAGLRTKANDEARKTLRLVIEMFIAEKENELAVGAIKPVTVRMLRSYLEGPLYVKPLHGHPIDSITLEDIADRVRAVAKNSGVRTAIGLRSALNNLFSWAMQNGKARANPVIGTKNPKPPPSRDRVLTDAEIASIWNALGDDDYAKVIKLLVLTAARRSEVAGMRWSELADGFWCLPAARSKNGRVHKLPVTPLMKEIIDTVYRRVGIDHLFGRRGYTNWNLKAALDKELGLKPWTHHDLRRSAATRMADLGVAPHVVECILNHQSGSKVAAIYNRSAYEREVREAMLLWSDHIASIVSGSKVVTLRPAAMTTTAATA